MNPPRSFGPMVFFLTVLAITTASCHEDPGVVGPPDPDPDPALSLDLQSNCYSWPEQEFSPENVAVLEAALPVGAKAVEFSLEDLEGNPWRLSTLLESRPVLLILGAYT